MLHELHEQQELHLQLEHAEYHFDELLDEHEEMLQIDETERHERL